MNRVGALGAASAGTRIVVQAQVTAKAEVIIGTTYEPGLGHFLVAGLGGVHAEVLDSVLLLPVPLPAETIARRLGETKLGAWLARLGKSASRDLAADVVGALTALQGLVVIAPDLIQSIDVNPLLVGPDGAIAVDALIVPRRAT